MTRETNLYNTATKISFENAEQWIKDAKVLKHGNKIAQLTIKKVNVDLYSATPETWDVLVLIRTGSMAHNIKLSTIALRKGMKLTHRGLTKNTTSE